MAQIGLNAGRHAHGWLVEAKRAGFLSIRTGGIHEVPWRSIIACNHALISLVGSQRTRELLCGRSFRDIVANGRLQTRFLAVAPFVRIVRARLACSLAEFALTLHEVSGVCKFTGRHPAQGLVTSCRTGFLIMRSGCIGVVAGRGQDTEG